MSRLGQIDLWVAEEPGLATPGRGDVAEHIDALAELVEELGERLAAIHHELWLMRRVVGQAQGGDSGFGGSMSAPYRRSP